MKRITLSLVVLVLCIGILRAQDKAPGSFGFQLGAGYIMKQDLTMTPMIHRAFSPSKVKLDYSRFGKLERNAEVQFSAYSTSLNGRFQYYWEIPEESEESREHSFTLLYITYKLGKKLVETERFGLSAGLRARSRLNVADYDYGIYWLSHFAYYFSHGLDVYTDLNYRFSEKQLVNVGISLPLFSLVSRSPYLVQNAEYFYDNRSNSSVPSLINYLKRSKLQSWGTSQIVDLKLGYAYAISGRLDFSASYLFAMDINSTPRKLTQFENSILAGLTFKF